MKKLIHNLRKQPEHHRTYLLHVLTLVSAFILLVLWTYSFGTNLTKPETGSGLKEGLKPFSVLKSNIIDGYKSISEPTDQGLFVE